MSLRLKIVLLITSLVALSLAGVVLYLSFYVIKPEIQKEIVRRIDYHISQHTNTLYRMMYQRKKGTELEKLLKPVFNANKEVVYIKLLWGWKSNWYYNYWAMSRNKVDIISTKKHIPFEFFAIHTNFGKKSIEDDSNIYQMLKKNTDNFEEIVMPMTNKFDAQQFFLNEDKKYAAATNVINAMIKDYGAKRKKNKKVQKISQPPLPSNVEKIVKNLFQTTNIYRDKIDFVVSRVEQSRTVKLIRDEIKAILNTDLRELNRKAFLRKKSPVKKNKYTWHINNLLSIRKNIQNASSRIKYLNRAVFNVIEHFRESQIFLYENKELNKVKDDSMINNINMVKLYRQIRKTSKVVYKGKKKTLDVRFYVAEIGISADEISSRLTPMLWKGIKSSGIFVLISIGFALLLSLYLIVPIHKLHEGAMKLRRDKSFRIKMRRKDEFGNLASTMNYLSDELTGELKKYEDLYKEATEDELTKLMVRRYFMSTLKSELQNASTEKRPTSIFMTDIDHFKKFNDTHGHQTGDIVLAAVAGILLLNTRSSGIYSDVAGRYGGEEFAVLLPDTPKEVAMEIAERIRKEIYDMAMKSTEGKDLRVAISIGVYTSNDSSLTSEEMIEKADKALYQSKENGRNRVTFGA